MLSVLLCGLQGSASEELAAASKLEDDVNFFQTTSPDVAKLFHLDPQVNRPALVMIKKEAENINHFSKSLDFVLEVLKSEKTNPKCNYLCR